MFNASSSPSPQYFLDHAILAPKNKDVYKTNQIILDHMAGNEITFFSADNIIDEEGNVNPIKEVYLWNIYTPFNLQLYLLLNWKWKLDVL